MGTTRVALTATCNKLYRVVQLVRLLGWGCDDFAVPPHSGFCLVCGEIGSNCCGGGQGQKKCQIGVNPTQLSDRMSDPVRDIGNFNSGKCFCKYLTSHSSSLLSQSETVPLD